MHYQTFQIENTLYLKIFKALDSSVKVVMDTTHVTVLYSFLPDASVFGIEPENVGGGLVFEVNFGGI